MDTLEDEEMKYLTGHSKIEFDFILRYMTRNQADAEWPTDKLRLPEQLLLTLIKYRLNLDYMLLSIMFKVNCRIVAKICSYWTNLMYDKLNAIDFWSFRAKSENLYTVILDCTEIPIEKPVSVEEQQITWSSYKNCNTFKGLVGKSHHKSQVYYKKTYINIQILFLLRHRRSRVRYLCFSVVWRSSNRQRHSPKFWLTRLTIRGRFYSG